MANLKEIAQWEDGIYQLERTDPVVGGEGGISNRQGLQLANRTAWLKQLVETLAPLYSPTFTGSPKAPTPAQTVNNTTIATTAFVKNAIAELVGSAPATLDTLAEIAAALGNDGKIKEVLLAEIAKKANATDFTTLKELLIGIPFPYPLAAVPSGCLAFNGQAFNKATYPILAQKYPSGELPDLRGEFLRGWDNGRGVDSSRVLLSSQGDAIRNITGTFKSIDYLGYEGGNNVFDARVNASGRNGITVQPGVSEFGTDYTVIFNASNVVPTASENRPRNIAFQYICLAK